MTEQEVKDQLARISRFRSIESRIEAIWKSIKTIRGIDNTGSHVSPFTRNHRESRQASSISIQFTKTRGDEDGTHAHLYDLQIEAYDLGEFLTAKLESELAKLEEEKKAL